MAVVTALKMVPQMVGLRAAGMDSGKAWQWVKI